MPLDVLGWCHRRGELYLTLVLPDGTRSLIPAAWTDLPASRRSLPGVQRVELASLGSRSHLLQARTVVNALLRRLEAADTVQPSTPQEMSHAAAELSRSTVAGRGRTRVEHARRGATRRRGKEAGATDGQDPRPHTRRAQ